MKRNHAVTPEKTGAAIIATLALAMLLASLGTSIANIALPTLSTAFAAPFAQVQAVVVAYLGALTLATLIAGRLGDRHGLKTAMIAGLGLFFIASLLCAIAPGLWALIGARALQGAGAAFLMTLAMALMRQTADESRIGRAMGLLGTVSALGTALGPSLGGVLLPLTGWRGIFWVQVPLAALALILAIATLPPDGPKRHSPAPRLGSVLNPDLAADLFVNLLVAAVMMTTLMVGPFYLGLGLGLPPGQVGVVMAVGPVISIFGGLPAGRLVDTCGGGAVRMAGLVLLSAGAFLMATVPNLIGVAGYLLAIGILTPGYQLFQAANNTTALAAVARDRRGTVAGLLSLSRNAGLIIGASLMGAIFAFGVGTESFADATASANDSGMRLTFWLAGGLMLVAIAVALWRSGLKR